MPNDERIRTERYRVVHDKIIGQIRTERLKKGDKIPSERKLCEEHGVSMITVRKALDMLVDENVIEKHQGSGNFVKEVKKAKIAFLLSKRYERPSLTMQMVRAINDESSTFELIPYALDNLSAFEVKQFLVENEMPSILLATEGVGEMARDNVLMALDDFRGFEDIMSAVPGNVDFRNIGPGGLVRHFSIPLFISPTVFAVNSDLAAKSSLPVDRGPRNWLEMLEWCEKFKEWAVSSKQDFYPTYGFSENLVSTNLSYLMAALGGPVLSDNLDEIGNPETGDFLELLSTMISRQYMKLHDRDDAGEHDLFAQGRFLFYMSARPWFVSALEKSRAGFPYRFFQLPSQSKDSRPVSGFGSARICIARMNASATYNRDACWRAAKDLASYAGLEEIALDLQSFPASVACMRRIVSKKPVYKAFFESIPNYRHYPASSAGNLKKKTIDSFLAMYLSEQNSPEIALGTLVRVVRRLGAKAPALNE